MSSYYATCPLGAEELLAAELKALQVKNPKPTRGGVAFESDEPGMIYRLAMYSSLHQRLLLILHRFQAATIEELYAGVQELDWSEHVAPDGSLRIDAKLRDCELGQTHFAALKVKDAICDQFRETYEQRPSVSIRDPDLRVDLFVHKINVQLAIDLGGMAKFPSPKGASGDAMEAALMLGFALKPEQPCMLIGAGGADLVVQAAARVAHWAPGLLRHQFGFERWQGHVPARWQALVTEAQAARKPELEHKLQVVELDSRCFKRAQEHVRAYGLAWAVEWPRQTMMQLRPHADAGLVINLLPAQAKEHMQVMASSLQKHFNGWRLLDRHEGKGGFRWPWPPSQNLSISRGKRELHLRCFELQAARQDAPAPVEEAPAPAFDSNAEAPPELRNRLAKNHKHLGRWARKRAVHCYRLYDADLPNFAAAVDVYQADELWAVIQEYEAPAEVPAETAAQRLSQLAAAVASLLALPESRLIIKQRQRQRGAAQYQKLGAKSQFHIVSEAGLKLQVNFTDYLDTGLFLDHREVRRWLGQQAEGQHVLNLFAYTGSATVHMVAGGARSSTTVDMSKTYLDWAQRNLALNQLIGSQHKFVQADCLNWLAEQSQDRSSKRYGLIFMDPPTFSSSKRMEGTLDIQRDHVLLIEQACRLLRPGGQLVFSNNFRKFKLDRDALADFDIEDMTASSLPEDFRRNPKIHVVYRIRRRAG